jgi:hypothetical protein
MGGGQFRRVPRFPQEQSRQGIAATGQVAARFRAIEPAPTGFWQWGGARQLAGFTSAYLRFGASKTSMDGDDGDRCSIGVFGHSLLDLWRQKSTLSGGTQTRRRLQRSRKARQKSRAHSGAPSVQSSRQLQNMDSCRCPQAIRKSRENGQDHASLSYSIESL